MTLDLSDRPIRAASEDRLNRGQFASAVASLVAPTQGQSSFVVGIEGPWGSGKSSLLNLLENELRKQSDRLAIVRFEAWREESSRSLGSLLVRRVAEAIGAGLSADQAKSFQKTLERLESWMDRAELLPALSTPMALGKRAIQSWQRFRAADARERDSFPVLLEELGAAIRQAGSTAVVIVDDLDRREHDEIRDVFRVAKAVLDLPGISYVLAYDRAAVVGSLSSSGVPNPEGYLEKIVQIPITLPPLSVGDRRSLLMSKLAPLLEAASLEQYEREALEELLRLGSLPHVVRGPRDIARLVSHASLLLPLTRREVNAADVIAYTALAQRFPAVEAAIRERPSDLVGVHQEHDLPISGLLLEMGERDERERLGRRRDRLFGSLESNERLQCEALVSFLFPDSLRAVRPGSSTRPTDELELRIRSATVFRRFLALGTGEEQISAATIRQVLRDPGARSRVLGRVLTSPEGAAWLAYAEVFLGEEGVSDEQDLLSALAAAVRGGVELLNAEDAYWLAIAGGRFAAAVAERSEDETRRTLSSALMTSPELVHLGLWPASLLAAMKARAVELFGNEDEATRLGRVWARVAVSEIKRSESHGPLLIPMLFEASCLGEREEVHRLVDELVARADGQRDFAMAFARNVRFDMAVLSRDPAALREVLVSHEASGEFPRGLWLSLGTDVVDR